VEHLPHMIDGLRWLSASTSIPNFISRPYTISFDFVRALIRFIAINYMYNHSNHHLFTLAFNRERTPLCRVPSGSSGNARDRFTEASRTGNIRFFQRIPIEIHRLTCLQLFAVGFHGLVPSPEIKALIRDYGLGGIVLFKRNIRDAEQLQVR
jgi:hypothetical protein